MSFKISFRRLAEVRILHSFYLENDVNNLFYELPTEEEKAQRMVKSGYDIRNDIIITPTEESLIFLKNHKMAFFPTPFGLVLAIEVEEKNGLTKPRANLPLDWRVAFEINIKNGDWQTFTNAKLKTTQSPLRLYWTNNDDVTGKILPSLAAPVAVFDAIKQYEMGEWTMQNNTPNRAQDNTGQWVANETYHQYATEADRRVLPRQCRFFAPMPAAIIVEVVLTKVNDATNPPFLAKWLIESPNKDTPLSKIGLDLTVNPIDKEFIPSGLYDLTIVCEDKNAVKKTTTYQKVVLLKDIKPNCFGVVELVQKAGLPDTQSLFNVDGSVVLNGRIFEIRLQNRITYWQYREQRGSLLNEIDNAFNDILDDSLVTKIPHALTRTQMPLDFADDIKLPSPSRLTLSEKNNRFYTEVMF